MFPATTRRLPRTLTSTLTRRLSTLPKTPRPSLKSHLQPFQPSQKRSLSTLQKWTLGLKQARRDIWRKNPILLPLALFSAAAATAIFTYIAYVEYTRVGPQYHKFPPPVAEALRSAVYYTEVDLSPPKALQAYKEALRIGIEMGMHPYSDEVVGIKIQVAMMLERAGLAKASVEVLERTKGEIMGFVEGKDRGEGVIGVKADKEDGEEKRKEMEEFEKQQRDRVLKKAVGIEMKLAELYSSDYIQDEKKAEAAQVAAVELCLKELHRRQSLGLPVGGGLEADNTEGWLNVTEIATALTDLAGRYTAQENYELSIPLQMRALDLLHTEEGDAPTCKQVVLLNSVAGCMAGQAQKPIRAEDPKKAREQLFDAAQQWAQKAIDVAAKIQPPVRDEECDTSCVAATFNLGWLAEFQGKAKEAERLYGEAKSLSQGLGFEQGVSMADAALKRLTKK
ncbi:TPR domain protein [Aspergillus bombycis]|uniref:TPR domain protein n=1 Tax=Aspergillus bombycis TaxID=109264 RepID=A0A1F8A5F3_9EURO|nr:TPR domain protein [Aspergillus bombycis]OGM46956.1 TPR domain protein [Aspergillus bombycis]